MSNAKIVLEVPLSEQHIKEFCYELLNLAQTETEAEDALTEIKQFVAALVRDEDFDSVDHKKIEQSIEACLEAYQQNKLNSTHMSPIPVSIQNDKVIKRLSTLATRSVFNLQAEYVEPDDPEKAVSLTVEGESYLRYQMMAHRLLFSHKLAEDEKDAAIVDLALHLLEREMNQISKKTGRQFVSADYLFMSTSQPD